MEFPTLKELKKLTAACRKVGISKLKIGDLEFTLSDDLPPSTYRKAKAKKAQPLPGGDVIDSNFKSDELSPEAMLFWSTGESTESTESDQ